MEQKAFRGKVRKAFGIEHIFVECVNISPSVGNRPRKSWRMRRKRGRKAYKVIGKRSRLSSRSWSWSSAIMI